MMKRRGISWLENSKQNGKPGSPGCNRSSRETRFCVIHANGIMGMSVRAPNVPTRNSVQIINRNKLHLVSEYTLYILMILINEGCRESDV